MINRKLVEKFDAIFLGNNSELKEKQNSPLLLPRVGWLRSGKKTVFFQNLNVYPHVGRSL